MLEEGQSRQTFDHTHGTLLLWVFTFLCLPLLLSSSDEVLHRENSKEQRKRNNQQLYDDVYRCMGILLSYHPYGFKAT